MPLEEYCTWVRDYYPICYIHIYDSKERLGAIDSGVIFILKQSSCSKIFECRHKKKDLVTANAETGSFYVYERAATIFSNARSAGTG